MEVASDPMPNLRSLTWRRLWQSIVARLRICPLSSRHLILELVISLVLQKFISVIRIPKAFSLMLITLSLCMSANAYGLSNRTPSKEMSEISDASLNLEYIPNYDRSNDLRIRYRLFLPRPFDQNHSYPLIVWLHGWGDRGDDNFSHLKHIDATIFRDGKDRTYPFFVLAPQCSRTPSRDWTTPLRDDAYSSSVGNDMLAITIQLLDGIQNKYPIDKKRITVVGISSGGTAAWEIGMRYPDRFAALAPLGSGGGDESRASAIRGIPIWSFHNTFDDYAYVEADREMVKAVEAAGGLVKLTEMPSNRHGAWTPAFQEFGLLEWLLERRRGEPSWRPFLQFTWRQTAAEIGLPVLIGIACWAEFRRRQRLHSNATLECSNHPFSDAKLPGFSELLGASHEETSY